MTVVVTMRVTMILEAARRTAALALLAKNKHTRERRAVVYPKGQFNPQDWLRFVQLELFERRWKRLRLTDDDLRALETCIMLDPQGPPVVEGTGGLRKVRFAPASWHTGKRGAARVGYVHFPDYGMIFLAVAYGKNEHDDLTPDEKRAIKRLIEEIDELLARGLIR